MFGCCGLKKNKTLIYTKDAETQSAHDFLVLESDNDKITNNGMKRFNLSDENVEKPVTIVEKPYQSPIANEDHSRSIMSDVKIEIFASYDDDVFCEGVGPPILAENLGDIKVGEPDFPKWFLHRNEELEIGGIQEPPATPVGKDELALRRCRFFSELLCAAQNANERKVHFDPLGPVVVGVDNQPAQEFEQLVTRLEKVTTRLEVICQPADELLKLNFASPELFNEGIKDIHTHTPEVVYTEETMSVAGYQDIINGSVAHFLTISQQIGGDVSTHSKMVSEAFQAQLQYLVVASQSKQPSQSEVNQLIQPTAQRIQMIQDFREKNRGSQYFNHLSAISESIPALGWVAVVANTFKFLEYIDCVFSFKSPTPAPYVKEMNDAGQFYTNRVLKDWKEKDKKHVEWVKAWVQVLTELQAFVKQNHTTGLVWSGKGTAPVGAMPPPPPGPPPPPVMMDLSSVSQLDTNNDRSALFAQINQGEHITKGLKKVTSEMQTHKNPTLRTGPAPFKAPINGSGVQNEGTIRAVDKPPVFSREGKKWMIEYQKGNHNLLVDGAEMNNVVYLFKCTDSTVVVKGKINSITLDSCKKTSVVFESLVSCIEFINCQSVQMQVLKKVPTISIDKTDGCQMYLSNESLEVEIVSSKSSEMNVLVPKPNGDYAEHPIPEQYKTLVVPGGLMTTVIESKG